MNIDLNIVKSWWPALIVLGGGFVSYTVYFADVMNEVKTIRTDVPANTVAVSEMNLELIKMQDEITNIRDVYDEKIISIHELYGDKLTTLAENERSLRESLERFALTENVNESLIEVNDNVRVMGERVNELTKEVGNNTGLIDRKRDEYAGY